jgi:hypothetical protein
MTARKKGASASRRTGPVKAILAKIPHSTGRGGLSFTSVSRMPVARYIAGGLALYGLVRLAMRMSSSYPQIGEFFSENLDTVEDKFRSWTSKGEEIVDSAH